MGFAATAGGHKTPRNSGRVGCHSPPCPIGPEIRTSSERDGLRIRVPGARSKPAASDISLGAEQEDETKPAARSHSGPTARKHHLAQVVPRPAPADRQRPGSSSGVGSAGWRRKLISVRACIGHVADQEAMSPIRPEGVAVDSGNARQRRKASSSRATPSTRPGKNTHGFFLVTSWVGKDHAGPIGRRAGEPAGGEHRQAASPALAVCYRDDQACSCAEFADSAANPPGQHGPRNAWWV